MIPVSLYLKNFMSYGENVPQLDFREFSLACLCGNNGNGKSAIIDAIIWALWGEGRKASSEKKPDDGLLRTGQTDMVVENLSSSPGRTNIMWIMKKSSLLALIFSIISLKSLTTGMEL